ncbi:MAG: DUF4373 domain-containing protein [Trichococcus flocculiformis]|uniref:DUF4373 domain-containing protein n=1 Tax=Trichococcus flocculiformis TaxID=82803 RepID=A0A847D9I1_9LACT|nr:DUF4373 domain-containing protein [Trichococcus flocculiformis]NLD33160.1 DUF4373 domain-containing protein [Trichococcus flocculiformis]
MTKNAYYFSHDSNARHDEKILMLRAEHGWEGYGIYWALVEMMFESTDTALSHDKLAGISLSLSIDMAALSAVIDTCIAEGLFMSDSEMFWSDSLRRRKSKFTEKSDRLRKQRSEAGRKGAAARWQKDGTDISTVNEKPDESNAPHGTAMTDDSTAIAPDSTAMTDDSKVKERKVKESKTHTMGVRETLLADFDEFWKKYPNKIKQEQAASLWLSIDPDQTLIEEIMQGLDRWLASDQWERGIYQSPINWLRDKRWMDHPPKCKPKKEQAGSHNYQDDSLQDLIAQKMAKQREERT